MSSVNVIPHTQVTAGSTGVANHQALSGGTNSGVLAGGMANFWDMIISQFGLSAEETAETGLTNASTNTNDPKTQSQKGNNPLALLQIALSSQTVDDNGNIILDTETKTAGKIERQLDLTNTIINHLKNVVPENGEKDGLLEKVLAKLQAKSDTLQASLSVMENGMISKDTPVEDLPLPIMIALGLNPAEITEVSEKIKDMQQKLGREITVEDLIAGVGGLIPVPNNAVVALKSSNNNTAVLDAIDENAQPTDDLAAQLNAMDVGAGDQDPEAGITNLKKDDAGLNKPEGLPVKDVRSKDQTIKPDQTDGHVKKDATAFKDHLVNLFNGGKTPQGELLFPATSTAAQSDSALFQPYGMAATSSLTLGTTAQAANMVSSPTVAGQNHPATQMVAATLIKAGKGGEDSTINLRLDPPELGNVAVRLQFSAKDKTVKAIVTAEKPETYMMLQRDAHALERALQSAGYDAGSQSISFELAQDNGAGRHDNNGEGANNFGKGGGNASQDAGNVEDIVQSSMTWQVDPSTGRMRYNILA